MARDTICFISGLPIQDGDPVAAIPVRRVINDARQTSFDWAPMGPAMRGLYDERVESLGGLVGENDGGDLCATAHGLRTSAELTVAIRRGYLKDPDGASVSSADVRIVLARLDAWDALLEIPLPMFLLNSEAGHDNVVFLDVAPLACKEAVIWSVAARELLATRELKMLKSHASELEHFANEPAWRSSQLPPTPNFDMIFHSCARQTGLITLGRAFHTRAERRIWDQLPRMDWPDVRVERACAALAEVAAARAIMRMLGKKFEPIGDGPGREHELGAWGAHLLWAERVRRIAKVKAFEPGTTDPNVVKACLFTEYEASEIKEASARGPRRAAL